VSESRIEPALTAAAWVDVVAGNGIPYAYGSSVLDELSILEGSDVPAAIAYLNSRLPDDDPRKITREKIRLMKNEVHANNVCGVDSRHFPLMQFAWALESYLRPPAAASSPEKPNG
jgi:hypothetical protein